MIRIDKYKRMWSTEGEEELTKFANSLGIKACMGLTESLPLGPEPHDPDVLIYRLDSNRRFRAALRAGARLVEPSELLERVLASDDVEAEAGEPVEKEIEVGEVDASDGLKIDELNPFEKIKIEINMPYDDESIKDDLKTDPA